MGMDFESKERMSAWSNLVTSLDAAVTVWFHVVAHARGASEFQRWALIRALILTGLCFSLLTGCFFGDSVVTETISLNLPPRANASHAPLSSDEPQVQEALKLIDL